MRRSRTSETRASVMRGLCVGALAAGAGDRGGGGGSAGLAAAIGGQHTGGAMELDGPGVSGTDLAATVKSVATQSHLSESNRRPALYKSAALPAELRWRTTGGYAPYTWPLPRRRGGATDAGGFRLLAWRSVVGQWGVAHPGCRSPRRPHPGRVFRNSGMIENKGLVKHFGHLVAVDGVSFSVQRGEVLGF